MKHVQQVDDRTCLHACLAMVTKLDIAAVIEELGRGDFPSFLMVSFLRRLGFSVAPGWDNRVLVRGRVYIVTTRSLTFPEGFHVVVVDCRGHEEVVLDPQAGRKDREAYTDPEDMTILDALEVIPPEVKFDRTVMAWIPNWSFSQSFMYARLKGQL